MSTTDPATANVRYHLFTSDHVTLYCKFSHRYGVDVRKQPQYNIHDWLDPSSSNFKAEIHNTIFHYGAQRHWRAVQSLHCNSRHEGRCLEICSLLTTCS